MSNGNHLVDNFEADSFFHYPRRFYCPHCEDKQEIYDIKTWINLVRELKSEGLNDYSFRRCLAECHSILVEGKTDCPACRRTK